WVRPAVDAAEARRGGVAVRADDRIEIQSSLEAARRSARRRTRSMGRLTPVVRRATRWALVVALALPVVLLPAGFALSQGSAPVKVKATQSVHSVSYLPVYVADKQGFFKKNGLDVEVTVTQGGGPDLQALLSGGVEFWFGGPINQLLAYGQNRDQRTLSVVAFFSNLGINLVMR